MNFTQLIKSILKKDKKAGARYFKSNPFKRPKPIKAPKSRIGITRKDPKLSKKRRRMAKESRRINRRK